MSTTTLGAAEILESAVAYAWDTGGFDGEPPRLPAEKLAAFILEKRALPGASELSQVFGWAQKAWDFFDKCYDQHQEDFPKQRIRLQRLDGESEEEMVYSGNGVILRMQEPDAEDTSENEENIVFIQALPTIERGEPDTEDTETDKKFFLVFNPGEVAPREDAHRGMLAVMEAQGRNTSPRERQRARRYEVLSTDVSEGVEAVHTLWEMVSQKHPEKKFRHPLVPVVQAWLQENPPVAEIAGRGSQIAPKFLERSHPSQGASLPLGVLHPQGMETQQLFLPSFETLDDSDVVVSALPIEMYQGGRGARGAPLDERIFFNALLARPYGKVEAWNGVRLEPTLRDFVNWLYPNGWNRTNQLPLLQKALYDVHNKRIRYERRDWNVVQVLAMPTEETQMDDALPLIIRYPDGVQGNGPLIDVHRMRRYGLVSASKWRAWIRLHYLWDTAKQRNGGYPIFATIPEVKRNAEGYLLDARGEIITREPYKNRAGKWAAKKGSKPQTAWYHPHAIRIGDTRNPQCEKIPVLTDKHLVALFFDASQVDKKTFWKRVHQAKNTAMDMEAEGAVVIERDAIDTKKGIKGWRIMPVFQDEIPG